MISTKEIPFRSLVALALVTALAPSAIAQKKEKENVRQAETPEELALRKQAQCDAVLALVQDSQVTHRTAKSGPWSAPDTWKNRNLPGNMARVRIMPGHTVIVDGILAAPLMTVRVDGILRFDPARSTRLAVDTLVVTESGTLHIGTRERPIGDSVTAELILDDLNDGIQHDDKRSPDYDPWHLGQGVVVLGSVAMHGAAKDGYATVSKIPAGVNRLTLDQAPKGWQIGDLIALPGYRIDGTGDELRRITAIQGKYLEFAGLQAPDRTVHGRVFSSDDATASARLPRQSLEKVMGRTLDENQLTTEARWNDWPYEPWRRDANGNLDPDFQSPVQRVQFKLHLINLSRNVMVTTPFDLRGKVRLYKDKGKGLSHSARRKTNSDDISEWAGRGCVILLHHNRGDFRYVTLAGLGRSDMTSIRREPTYDNPREIQEPAYNPTGRDPLTVYWADNETPPAHIIGCAVYDAPGHGVNNYASNARIESCVTYHVGNAGFAVTQYDATGTLLCNIAMRSVGKQDGRTGYMLGHGFDCESTHMRIEDNVAAGFSNYGFQFNGEEGRHANNKRPMCFDPEISVDDVPAYRKDARIRKQWAERRYRNNTAYGGRCMINTMRYGANYLPKLLTLNWFGHGIDCGMDRLYAPGNNYVNTVLFHHPDTWGEGAGFGRHSNSGGTNLINCHVFGFDIGCSLSAQKDEQVIGGRWQNIINIHAEWRPKNRHWRVSYLVHEPEFIPFPDGILPDKPRADLSCARASVYNDSLHGYPIIYEFRHKGRTHQIYTARESHPDYVDLEDKSNQELHDTLRYSDPAVIKKFGLNLQEELGIDRPWFCSVKPPPGALVPPDRTIGLEKRPSGKGNSWRNYWIEQKQFGLTFQNIIIQPDITPSLKSHTYRRLNLRVNKDRPITFNDLTRVPAPEGAGEAYEYRIDCSPIYFNPLQPASAEDFQVLESMALETAPDASPVKSADFVRDGSGRNTPILRVIFHPDKAGKHFLSVGNENNRENLILHYLGRQKP